MRATLRRAVRLAHFYAARNAIGGTKKPEKTFQRVETSLGPRCGRNGGVKMDFNMPLYEPVAGSGGEKINTAGKTAGNFRKAISIRNFNHRYIKKKKKK